MNQCPVFPCRLRTRLASNAGCPQSPLCCRETAARIIHRVSAVLTSSVAPNRKRKTGTDFCAAANVRRRLVTRSKTFGFPGVSMTTAPSAAQDNASLAARNPSSGLAAKCMRARAGLKPSSRRPVAESSPYSRAEKSCLIQNTRFSPATRIVRPITKPVAAAS